MNSLMSIVVVLSGKENYQEWLRKIKNTLIFNDLLEGVCEGKDDNEPEESKDEKQIAILSNKDKKAYALISALVT